MDPAVLWRRLGQLAVPGHEFTDGDVQRPRGVTRLPLVVLADVQQEVAVLEVTDLDRGHTSSETHAPTLPEGPSDVPGSPSSAANSASRSAT